MKLEDIRMRAFIVLVLLVAAAPAFGQSERYTLDFSHGYNAANSTYGDHLGDTWYWYNCAKNALPYGNGRLAQIEDERDESIRNARWNVEQLDYARRQYESGNEPQPPSFTSTGNTSTAKNGWPWLRVLGKIAGVFGIAADAWTYYTNNKNYNAAVLYQTIHDNYNKQRDSIDDRMRDRTLYCIEAQNNRRIENYNNSSIEGDNSMLSLYGINYAGDNNWLAYPKGKVYVDCVANC